MEYALEKAVKNNVLVGIKNVIEAAQLVIQAGALGNGGEVFVLDMGEPAAIINTLLDLVGTYQ